MDNSPCGCEPRCAPAHNVSSPANRITGRAEQRSNASHLTQAVKLSGDYLERACDPIGRFAYKVNTDSGGSSASYNIVRHAGAIYSLSMLNRLHADPEAVSAMIRAARFIQANYIGPDAGSDRLVAWSRPLPTKSDAE